MPQDLAERLTAPPAIAELVAKFDEHKEHYKRGDYNETQLRRDFLDPYFAAMGWDLDNRKGYSEKFREVIHEDALRVELSVRAPDYCFRVGGQRQFFVEAKKPAVNIREDAAPAFQLRRYAWTAKLPLSILTDFEELAVYDCRIKPDKNDKASVGRVMLLKYTDYVEKWHELASIFSFEAINRGAFDKYAESNKKKRGTAEVDEAFLEEIESWRYALARNISLRNKPLTEREVNTAVQLIIDRTIFLRMCEGRGIEPFGRLQALLNGDEVYRRLVELFKRADEKYNSGLFHFQQEKGRTDPDTLTTALVVDDKVLKDIVRRLYYPDSPYEFAALPADILGQVYEQFLGKVIRLTKSHQAKIEEKPEVRKAGGVYYTPTYIVDYIVENTVGKLLEGQTPQQVGGLTKTYQPAKTGRPLTVLDPACGSGSFLIVAYQYLLDWYLKQYTEEDQPEKHAQGKSPRIYHKKGGDWRLTTPERKRILLSHIYGVDIDYQACEVTKLSLLLKVLEGETDETLQRQLFEKERALPDLANNIKCGNSLIGPDFYRERQGELFDEEETLRINAFDWQAEFKQVFSGKNPGFDAVVGNPPYIRIQTLQETAPATVDYYGKKYKAAQKGNYDIYVVFVERGLGLLGNNGRLGYILPHKFFNAQYGIPLRQHLSTERHLSQIVHFGHQQVFVGATTYTCLLFLSKETTDTVEFVKVSDLGDWQRDKGLSKSTVSANLFDSREWNITTGPTEKLLKKLAQLPIKLSHVAARMSQGIRTSANQVYVLDSREIQNDHLVAWSKSLDAEVLVERDAVSTFLQGREIKRYDIRQSGKVVIIPYEMRDGKAQLLEEDEYRSRYPQTFSYLENNRTVLQQREKGRMRGRGWYGYVYPKNLEVMQSQKILVPDIADSAAFAFDSEADFTFTSGYGITLKPDVHESPLYILGLLNSDLLDLFLKSVSTVLRGGYFRYFTQFIEQLPIHPIDFSSEPEKRQHDQMVGLVQQMLDFHKRLPQVKTSHERTAIERQIAATDREIDQLVYQLYGLSDKEIALVEEATG